MKFYILEISWKLYARKFLGNYMLGNSWKLYAGKFCMTSFVLIHYNVKHFKGSWGKNESRYSMIMNCKFCACVMQITGVPQLQVIYMERLYGCK